MKRYIRISKGKIKILENLKGNLKYIWFVWNIECKIRLGIKINLWEDTWTGDILLNVRFSMLGKEY